MTATFSTANYPLCPSVQRKKFRRRQEMYERTFSASSSDSKSDSQWLKSIMDYCIQDQNVTLNDLEVITTSPTISTSSSESDELQFGWPWIDPPRLRKTGFKLSNWLSLEIGSKIPVIWPLGLNRLYGSKTSGSQGAIRKNLIQLIGNTALKKGQPTLKHYHKGRKLIDLQTKLPSVRQLRTLDFGALN
jgi:hypothetical protein